MIIVRNRCLHRLSHDSFDGRSRASNAVGFRMGIVSVLKARCSARENRGEGAMSSLRPLSNCGLPANCSLFERVAGYPKVAVEEQVVSNMAFV